MGVKMPVKELLKPTKPNPVKIEKQIEQFISKGGSLTTEMGNQEDDHRLTLRIPKKTFGKNRRKKERKNWNYFAKSLDPRSYR